MKKFLILFSALSLSFSAIAQSNDYSKGNSNPFAHYVYKSDEQWQAAARVTQQTTAPAVNYFSNQLSNPLQLKGQGKYKNLIANSQSLNGCWDKAGAAYGVDPWLLFSIAKVESGFNGTATNWNRNKSVDIGLMQINSSWLPTLGKFGISSRDLFDPCTSVFIGAWIMAQNIRHFGYNQDGIGAYNSPGNITIRRAYAQKVYSAYNELMRDFRTPVYLESKR